MIDQVGWGELAVLVLLALFVFGPDRLPSLAADAGRTLHRVRRWFRVVVADVKQDLGPELGDLGGELRSLRSQVWVDDERTPFADRSPASREEP